MYNKKKFFDNLIIFSLNFNVNVYDKNIFRK